MLAHRQMASLLLSAVFSRAMSVSTASKPALATRTLGSSKLLVTEACLGTMTWGVQNSEEEAHAQLDYAIKERGVNFVDTVSARPPRPY